jgi:hypothetical protein
VVGGAAVTEELVPGFRFSRASYLLSLLRPDIVRDLDLKVCAVPFRPQRRTLHDAAPCMADAGPCVTAAAWAQGAHTSTLVVHAQARRVGLPADGPGRRRDGARSGQVLPQGRCGAPRLRSHARRLWLCTPPDGGTWAIRLRWAHTLGRQCVCLSPCWTDRRWTPLHRGWAGCWALRRSWQGHSRAAACWHSCRACMRS